MRARVDMILILLLVVWVPIIGVLGESSDVVHFELQPNPNAGVTIDGVGYSFWTAVVTSSSYGTGNMVMIFKRTSGSTYVISVYVAGENLVHAAGRRGKIWHQHRTDPGMGCGRAGAGRAGGGESHPGQYRRRPPRSPGHGRPLLTLDGRNRPV